MYVELDLEASRGAVPGVGEQVHPLRLNESCLWYAQEYPEPTLEFGRMRLSYVERALRTPSS